MITHQNFFFFAKPGVNLSVNVFINSFNIITDYKIILLDNLNRRMLIKQENLRFKTFRMKKVIFLEILFEYTIKVPILRLEMFQLCVTHFTEVFLKN